MSQSILNACRVHIIEISFSSYFFRTFLISHAHFDHVAGLVIGAGATTSENVRFVVGLPSVIKDLQTIFDGQKLWPRLVRQKNEPKLSFAYIYDP